MFAQVSFPISSFQTFTYRVPSSLLKSVHQGTCVNATINRKLQAGFVISISDNTSYSGKILFIDSIREQDLHIPSELWNTLEWISKYYIAPIGQVLKAAVPNSFLKTYKPQLLQFVQITKIGKEKLALLNKKPAQTRVMKKLSILSEPVRVSSLKKYVSSPYTICKDLEKKGFINSVYQPKITDPFKIMGPGNLQNIKLSIDQQKVIENIQNSNQGFNPYLLHGVTGSGKTEVYLKLAQNIVKNDKSVLVLVPEIALTPQVANRFRKAFGKRVALWHSRMTKAEKGWTWQQLKNGYYSVVVGARSAIFSPLKNIGLIIIDEEQESSYKQENPSPRYNARDVAMVRGKNANAVVLLTSATPCLESYYNTLQSKYSLLKLNKRYGSSQYPSVKLVDMKKEYINNENVVLSRILIKEIDNRLAKNEQIIILQNRRGYSRVHQCLDCGEIKKCKQCSVSLILHKTDNSLHCHYCEYSEIPSFKCEICNAENMIFSGSGTQHVEDIINQKFPNANTLRMDIDTVGKRDSHLNILTKFSNKDADILIGTQMIAKGLDFENVTLVGVINADSGLFFPDFRAGERVFQLIYQVSGRAGRREKPGLSIIQTYNPDDEYIKTAASLDIKKFYNISLSQRQELNYPPFSRIGRIIFSGQDKLLINQYAKKIAKKLANKNDYIILGPSLAPIEKIKGDWRIHLIIKTSNKNNQNIHKFLYNKIGFKLFEKKWNGIKIVIDIDPLSML